MEYPYFRIRCNSKRDMNKMLDEVVPGKWFVTSYKLGIAPRREGFYHKLSFGIVLKDKEAAALLMMFLPDHSSTPVTLHSWEMVKVTDEVRRTIFYHGCAGRGGNSKIVTCFPWEQGDEFEQEQAEILETIKAMVAETDDVVEEWAVIARWLAPLIEERNGQKYWDAEKRGAAAFRLLHKSKKIRRMNGFGGRPGFYIPKVA